MRQLGKVVRWDDQRGFGFIRSGKTSQDIFFHIRDCAGGIQPPLNAAVEFEEIHMGGKGPRAMAVRPLQRNTPASANHGTAQRDTSSPRKPIATKERTRASQEAPAPSLLAIGGLSLVWLALLAWGVQQHRLPVIALAVAFAINCITFFVYRLDKYAARKGQWRTSEDTLHLFSLAGGWPAARFAQQVLRHKTIKPSFQATYWLTVWVHLAALGGYVFWVRLRPLLGW